MQPKQSGVVRGIARGTVLAVLLHPLAYSQDFSSAPAQDLLPDSPGAVQSRPLRLQAMATQNPGSAQTGSNPSTEPTQTTQLNDVAGEARQDPATAEQSGQPASNSATTQQPVSNSSNGASSPQPQNPKEPVGTAAAESISTTGVAASRPAGVAVAPAKQRRVRSILIKMGALAGVGIAIGTTMALSQGSPSKPPGSH
jgi:hypothetical protein